MRSALLIACSILCSIHLMAQERLIQTPKLSPFQTTEIKIGIVKVKLEYSRPSMRGRTIFGDLVPYDKIWRTGANLNTQITFNDPVQIGTSLLEAGTYTIFTKPHPKTWEVYFHKVLKDYGAPEVLDPKNILAQVSIPVVPLTRTVETLSINFDQLTKYAATLAISWEQSYVPIPIQIPSGNIMASKLELATVNLASDYAAAAWNYFDIEKDIPQALAAIDQAIQLTEQEQSFEEWLEGIDVSDWGLPWAYQIKSQMHAANGDKEKAIAAAKRSLAIAQRLDSGDAYIKENKENIKRWEGRE